MLDVGRKFNEKALKQLAQKKTQSIKQNKGEGEGGKQHTKQHLQR